MFFYSKYTIHTYRGSDVWLGKRRKAGVNQVGVSNNLLSVAAEKSEIFIHRNPPLFFKYRFYKYLSKLPNVLINRFYIGKML